MTRKKFVEERAWLVHFWALYCNSSKMSKVTNF